MSPGRAAAPCQSSSHSHSQVPPSPATKKAATAAVDGFLEAGQSTVGTHMDVSHDAATPLGMRVWAEAELIALDGRALTFAVSAFDDTGPIGKGLHTRFVIQAEKFMAKANGKAGK